MNIANISSNTTFSARSFKLRDAEKICRLVNAQFPAVSATKYAEFNSAQNNPKMLNVIKSINSRLEQNVRAPFDKSCDKNSPLQAIIDLINLVKKSKLANCAEFAKLCAAICNINDIKVVQPRLTLVNKDKKLTGVWLDHAIIMYKPSKHILLKRMCDMKDTIIIDPWLGIADFAPKIEQKFKSEYSKFFKIPENCDIALTTITPNRIKYDDETSTKLRKLFPQFVIKK